MKLLACFIVMFCVSGCIKETPKYVIGGDLRIGYTKQDIIKRIYSEAKIDSSIDSEIMIENPAITSEFWKASFAIPLEARIHFSQKGFVDTLKFKVFVLNSNSTSNSFNRVAGGWLKYFGTGNGNFVNDTSMDNDYRYEFHKADTVYQLYKTGPSLYVNITRV